MSGGWPTQSQLENLGWRVAHVSRLSEYPVPSAHYSENQAIKAKLHHCEGSRNSSRVSPSAIHAPRFAIEADARRSPRKGILVFGILGRLRRKFITTSSVAVSMG